LRLEERFSEVIALEFDFACTARLQVYDAELEETRLVAMSWGLIGKAFSTGGQDGPRNGKVSGEITQANFRDQGF
jgi:hypothetical protein